jgi:hypothetical protein
MRGGRGGDNMGGGILHDGARSKNGRVWSGVIEGGCLGAGYARDGLDGWAACQGRAGGSGGRLKLAHDLALLLLCVVGVAEHTEQSKAEEQKHAAESHCMTRVVAVGVGHHGWDVRESCVDAGERERERARRRD